MDTTSSYSYPPSFGTVTTPTVITPTVVTLIVETVIIGTLVIPTIGILVCPTILDMPHRLYDQVFHLPCQATCTTHSVLLAVPGIAEALTSFCNGGHSGPAVREEEGREG
ncbi:hypothetical protein A1F94_012489 [Pyrenophora tritici-repentis]|uniref:Uncharacterized protein n=1 Tax=Pyrenophora tritici-repentis TaxID=45151 RepID=A0A2W1DJ21_9PLEO|nr:hypothetical protein PtrV1_09187 [Pyrenophora tritici-repentis]KAF7568073.1 hypothetical protein PtrM4_126860 [Pyrenophora tritici-repentis]KAG9376889.1 hypothetical protein A1F94_012489 [Pyrenophora tritici-repentis]KAI0572535.1 hypothetical protein Alg215_09717 [Pyrenophora tritici-repentis]KAI0578274.1 hypothetical protein Alg130_08022 [Pyrenophora tritici-repentis]